MAAIRLGRMTALLKPNGGVGGIGGWRHRAEVGGKDDSTADE